ncbi:MAG: RagB/SusD family nutrient uptake outer membrane protein [Barnesiella sp.]
MEKYLNIGGQTAADPLFNYWSHFKVKPSPIVVLHIIYMVQYANVILFKPHKSVPQISDDNVNMWSAEAKFLIAYYHYCLLRLYGPIVIIEEKTPFEGPEEVMYPKRQPYDKCVEWIANLLDEVAFILPPDKHPVNSGNRPVLLQKV